MAQRVPCERGQPVLVGDSSPVLCPPSAAMCLCPFSPSAWSAGWVSQEHWWVCIILTNPRCSGNYTAMFVHNRRDPRRLRVRWFFTPEAKLGINSFPDFFSLCKVWGNPRHRFMLYLSALEHLALSTFPSYLALLLTAALLPLMLIWNVVFSPWNGSLGAAYGEAHELCPVFVWALEQPGWESWMRVKFAALRNSIHGRLLEENQHFMCPGVHLSLVIHFIMH